MFHFEKDLAAVATVIGSVKNRSNAVTMSANPDDTDAFSTIDMCESSVMLWSCELSNCIDP